MSKSPSPEILISDLRKTVRVIRENLSHQEKLLEQTMAALQQRETGQRLSASSAEASTAAWRLVRENLSHQEKLLEQIMIAFQQCESAQRLSMPSAEVSAAAWRPPEDGAAMTGLRPMIKVHKVEPCSSTSDIVTRLKEGWIGRFYVDHLKKNPLIRKLVIAIWRNFYPMYACYVVARLSRAARCWRPIVKLADYVEVSNIPLITVLDAARVDTPAPKVIPAEDQAHLVSPHDHYEFPPIYVAQLSDVEVYGGTNLVFVPDAAICHDLYDFERDYTSEELKGRHVIDIKKKRMRLVRNDATPEQVPVAAAFLDACAANYAHWLTEVLPRIAAFCSVEQYANVPIIVDDGLHRNIMESLALVVGNDREIIVLPVGRAISVAVLYMTSVTGYVPFERRDARLVGHSHGLFSPLAFDLLRKRILPFTERKSHQGFPKKIYLRRTSGARKITNGTEIEESLVGKGYVVVEPEKLSFLQQVALFNNLEEVVGPSGAALVNQIFVPSEARVHVLIGKYDGTSYWYWQNMACASGKQVLYSLGDLHDSQSTIHSDFVIDPEVFRYAD